MMKYFIKFRWLSVFIVFLLLFIAFAVLSPGHRFINQANMKIYLAYGAEFNIIALAVGILMISGEFDLSIGSILVFCAFVFLKLFESSAPIVLAVLITLAVGALIGLLHGAITVKTGIPSFITTLGAMMFWRGLTLLWSQGLQTPLETERYPLLSQIFTGTVAGVIPVQFLWFLAIAALFALLIHRHQFGNWVFATGDHKLASKAMGINTDTIKMICFTLVGLVCSLVAIMQIMRVETFSSRAGDGWELKAIAAAVVGGTALTGGIGNIIGVFWGALIISAIENGLVILRLPYHWTYIIFGIVIVVSVVINAFIEQKRLTMGVERC
jgi:simple sugar transport system permease protein